MFAILYETLACVDNQYALIASILSEDHNKRGNAGAEEYSGRQADYGVDTVFLDELCAYFPFTLCFLTQFWTKLVAVIII